MVTTLIEIKNKTELIINLCNLIGENIVFYYICLGCDNDQVTYDNEFTYGDLKQLIEKGCLYVSYDCTDCGDVVKFLQADNIAAIEVINAK